MSEPKGAGEYPVIVFINTRYVRSGKEEPVRSGEEIVEISKFETQPATVHRGYGLTMNLGNFESARVEVSVTVPCYVEDLAVADEFAKNFVDARIKEEVASVRGGSNPEKQQRPRESKRGAF